MEDIDRSGTCIPLCPECNATVTGGMLVPRTEQGAVFHSGDDLSKHTESVDGVTLEPCLHSRWRGDEDFRDFMEAFHSLAGLR